MLFFQGSNTCKEGHFISLGPSPASFLQYISQPAKSVAKPVKKSTAVKKPAKATSPAKKPTAKRAPAKKVRDDSMMKHMKFDEFAGTCRE